MTKLFLAVAFACAALLAPLPGLAQNNGGAPQLDCARGPVPKNFGATPWLVYACSDDKSLVVVSAPGNAGGPFYFMLFMKNGARQVVGEGAGAKNVTSAAYQDLIKLSETDIAALIRAARAVPVIEAK